MDNYTWPSDRIAHPVKLCTFEELRRTINELPQEGSFFSKIIETDFRRELLKAFIHCMEANKKLKEENAELVKALRHVSQSLKTAMTGYAKEANNMPNYDINNSELFEAFRGALSEGNKALEGKGDNDQGGEAPTGERMEQNEKEGK